MKMNARTRCLGGWVAILLLAASCAAPQVGLQAGALRPAPDTPNGVSTQHEGGPAPLVFEGGAEEARARLLAYLDSEDQARVEAAEGWYVHAVFTTPTMAFQDDVEFLIVPDEGVVHVRSASRAGFWDLGANARRVERIRAEW